VFFTIDAGPQVKAVCLPEGASKSARAWPTIEGVERVIQTGLGPGARVLA
jgi:diphosphomevalonate decarboxylase